MIQEYINQISSFLQIIYYINIWNIIDIILLTLLFYSILKPIRRTKGEIAIKGLLVVGIVMKLSDILGLTGINWLIEITLNYGVIACIVIFQPEFRKILESFGKKTDFSLRKNNSVIVDELILTISKACDKLSSSKTGALIAITRSIPLTDYLTNSTPLDSVITENLLCNIFIDGSPLHDGAIIIDNFRIQAANCVLPLSTRDLPTEFGTRHRAALGLSEVTDAVVIVVSEETGRISVCSSGNIERCSDKIALINNLNKLFKIESKEIKE